MTYLHSGSAVIFEPESDLELASWRPMAQHQLQLIRLSAEEYWVFVGEKFLGAATKLPLDSNWQAISALHGWCVAPLRSPEEAAERLYSRFQAD